MKTLRQLYFRLFKRYQRLEIKFFTYTEADAIIRTQAGKPEEEQWVIAKEEDTNHVLGLVYLERRKRIVA